MKIRFIPEHTKTIINDLYVIYINEDTLTAIMYIGKSNKPKFNYRFKTINILNTYVDTAITNFMTFHNDKVQRKENQKELQKTFDISKFLKVGAIIQNTWGYEQTNQEFYQVTEIKGKTTIHAKELKKIYEETGFMSGKCIPLIDHFLDRGNEYNLRTKASGDSFTICNPKSFYYFHVWNGTEQYESHYA